MTILEMLSKLPEAVWLGFFGLPTIFLAHRLGMQQQADKTESEFDQRMLDALSQRDKTINEQTQRIQGMADQQGKLYERLGENNAALRILETRVKDADNRNRDLLCRVSELEAITKQIDDCKGVGGEPCPLAEKRRKMVNGARA